MPFSRILLVAYNGLVPIFARYSPTLACQHPWASTIATISAAAMIVSPGSLGVPRTMTTNIILITCGLFAVQLAWGMVDGHWR